MRPGIGMAARAGDGRCLIDVRHLVEVRCGRALRPDGTWGDVWRVDAPEAGGHLVAELATQRVTELRAQGFTARVRPVVL